MCGAGGKPITSEETVTIPKAEYEALLQRCEDLEDIVAAMKADDGTRIPHEVVRTAMLDDTSPMAAFRKYRGITLRELSELTSLSASYLSEIESGRKAGSAEAWRRIAEALDTTMDSLVGW